MEAAAGEVITLSTAPAVAVLVVAIHPLSQEGTAVSAAAGANNLLVPAVSAAAGDLRARAGSVAAAAQTPMAVMAAAAAAVLLAACRCSVAGAVGSAQGVAGATTM